MKQKRSSKSPSLLTLTEGETLLGWVYFALDFLVLPTAISLLGEQFGGFSPSITNFLYYLCNGLCCGLVFRKSLRSSLERAGKAISRFSLCVFAGFLLLLGANQLLTGICEFLIPHFVNENNAAIAALVRQSPHLMTLGTVVLVPLAEECLFRGLMFFGIRQQNRSLAYILSTLTFAAVHVIGYLGTMDGLTLALCFAQYLPAGIVLAWAGEQTDSLFASMLIHGAINACAVVFVS